MKSRSPKLPFDAMPRLPSDDDEEVAMLTEILAQLPNESVYELARCLLRAALAQERFGEVAHLTRLAEDMLTTIRLQRYLPSENSADSTIYTPSSPRLISLPLTSSMNKRNN